MTKQPAVWYTKNIKNPGKDQGDSFGKWDVSEKKRLAEEFKIYSHDTHGNPHQLL